VFAGSDACFAPVLTFADSRRHPHVAARGGTIEVGGIAQPAPAPRFDRTPGAATRPPPERGSGGSVALQRWGFDAMAIDVLRELGVRCS
jgi:alpha-methylacyl-CoA racemase